MEEIGLCKAMPITWKIPGKSFSGLKDLIMRIILPSKPLFHIPPSCPESKRLKQLFPISFTPPIFWNLSSSLSSFNPGSPKIRTGPPCLWEMKRLIPGWKIVWVLRGLKKVERKRSYWHSRKTMGWSVRIYSGGLQHHSQVKSSL